MTDRSSAKTKSSVAEGSAQRIFIAGTDTDAGKTIAAASLLQALRNNGFTTAALKPIAAGGMPFSNPQGVQEWRNEDAILLRDMASFNASYAQVNPLCFERPIAPHIAALQESRPLSVAACLSACEPSLQLPVDFLVIEGAGGWLVPLNENEAMSDLVLALEAGVILVVGVKLGCLNHAMLTYQSMLASGCRMIGWVANYLEEPSEVASANIDYLQHKLGIPLLGTLGFRQQKDYSAWANELDVSCLLQSLKGDV